MLDKLMDLYHQYYSQFMTWYQAADEFTQYVVIIVSGVFVLMMILFIVLSKITK
jgi:hypothetical protein